MGVCVSDMCEDMRALIEGLGTFKKCETKELKVELVDISLPSESFSDSVNAHPPNICSSIKSTNDRHTRAQNILSENFHSIRIQCSQLTHSPQILFLHSKVQTAGVWCSELETGFTSFSQQRNS